MNLFSVAVDLVFFFINFGTIGCKIFVLFLHKMLSKIMKVPDMKNPKFNSNIKIYSKIKVQLRVIILVIKTNQDESLEVCSD